MQSFLFLLLAFSFTCQCAEPLLVLNEINQDSLPENFRTCRDPFRDGASYSREGLDSLLISGSAQFSENEFQQLIKKIAYPKKIHVVDLRAESHGFLNGMAISWVGLRNDANANKTPQQIAEDESRRLDSLKRLKVVIMNKIVSRVDQTISKMEPLKVNIENVASEAELVAKNGVEYFRDYVLDLHRPTDEQVDLFLNYVKSLKEKEWLHFHCEAGEGRTTTFMCMYDMLHNADKLSFEVICGRQSNLAYYPILAGNESGNWLDKLKNERLLFLKAFYQYAKVHGKTLDMSWVQYNKQPN